MRESVTAIFFNKKSGNIFTIKRQNYLKVFPGYTSFPGGKVDKTDFEIGDTIIPTSMQLYPHHFIALKREIQEELNFSVDLSEVYCLAQALTPEFNPYRFNVFFYVVPVEDDIEFDIDDGEADVNESGWFKPSSLLESYFNGTIMAVPPVVKIIKELSSDINVCGPLNVGLEHDEVSEVPMIESIYGVRQFLPLSNTFPPANRTNCFIIGDEGSDKFLIDPSPKDRNEYLKLKKSLDKVGFDKILITHHHSDHHEFLNSFVEDYGVKVYLSSKTKELLDKKFGLDYLDGINLEFLKEEDFITYSGGKKVSILEVPGHDEGQLALKREDNAWVLVGDLIQTVGTVVIGGPEGDMGKYFKSLERVIALSPIFCIPSHGIAIGGTHKLELTLTHRTMRESEILGLYERGKSKEEILEIVYAGLKAALLPYAMKTIEAHLQKLFEDGKIKR
jgi:ribonuclease/clavin/mitogillin